MSTDSNINYDKLKKNYQHICVKEDNKQPNRITNWCDADLYYINNNQLAVHQPVTRYNTCCNRVQKTNKLASRKVEIVFRILGRYNANGEKKISC